MSRRAPNTMELNYTMVKETSANFCKESIVQISNFQVLQEVPTSKRKSVGGIFVCIPFASVKILFDPLLPKSQTQQPLKQLFENFCKVF